MWMMGFGYLWMLLGLLVSAAILALLIWVIVHFAHWSATHAAVEGSGAGRILDERYARGEIGWEEYQRIRQDLA